MTALTPAEGDLDLLDAAAREAGDLALRYFGRDPQSWTKGLTSIVSEADFAVDRLLADRLTSARPDYGWLSEETADNEARLQCRRVWIVDPLDGTKEFIQGIPEFCVAVALVEEGHPVLGVTYNPITREMFWSARGMGCHLNTEAVRVTRTRVLRRANVLASRSETARGEWEVFHGRLKVSPTGSVAYKLALVAAGKGDATFTRSPKSEWDIASGAALLAEAGGTMTDIHGTMIRFNQRRVKVAGMIADNTVLHEQLVKIAPHPERVSV